LRRSETTDGCVDDPSVSLLDRFVNKAEALEAAWLEIFDEDIGAGSQLVSQSQVC